MNTTASPFDPVTIGPLTLRNRFIKSGANIRRTSPTMCQPSSDKVMDEVADEMQEEADECNQAKERLLAAKTAEEVEVAKQVMHILCNNWPCASCRKATPGQGAAFAQRGRLSRLAGTQLTQDEQKCSITVFRARFLGTIARLNQAALQAQRIPADNDSCFNPGTGKSRRFCASSHRP